MKDSLFRFLTVLTKPAVAVGGALILGGGLVAYTYVSTNVSPSGTTVAVTRGTLTEEVDVTGVVKAAHTTDLSFETAGRIASINVSVGDHVSAGQTLLTLDGATQAAALAGAKANLEVQQAKLAALVSGTRPEQLAIDQTAVAQAENALQDAAESAYVSADDAVHVKADQIFSNPRTGDAILALSVSDQSLVARIQGERNALEPAFTAWQTTLADASTSAILATASTSSAVLAEVSTFLDDLAKALGETPVGGSVTATTLSGYQVNVNAARTAVSGALASVTAAVTSYKSAEGALTLAEAGATPDDLAAEQALVDAAAAAVQSAQVAMNETSLRAPISGTVTAQSADPGETVTPLAPLVSMIADGRYQATARVSEADIAKVHLGQDVQVSFDAYPGVSFPAKVTTVDPAASLSGGVSSYGVTATFDENDPRITSGLSANLHILTTTKAGVLSVPSSAVITDGNDTFVFVRGPGAPVKTPVTTGITSIAEGRTEIVSGLTEGEKVLTYGSNVTP